MGEVKHSCWLGAEYPEQIPHDVVKWGWGENKLYEQTFIFGSG